MMSRSQAHQRSHINEAEMITKKRLFLTLAMCSAFIAGIIAFTKDENTQTSSQTPLHTFPAGYKKELDKKIAADPDNSSLLTERIQYHVVMRDFDSSFEDFHRIVALGDKGDPNGAARVSLCMHMEVAEYPTEEVKSCYEESLKTITRLREQKGRRTITDMKFSDSLDGWFISALLLTGSPDASKARDSFFADAEATAKTEFDKRYVEVTKKNFPTMPFDREKYLNPLRENYGLPLKP